MALKEFPHVFKTDVKFYFASIDTVILERIVYRITHTSLIPHPRLYAISSGRIYSTSRN